MNQSCVKIKFHNLHDILEPNVDKVEHNADEVVEKVEKVADRVEEVVDKVEELADKVDIVNEVIQMEEPQKIEGMLDQKNDSCKKVYYCVFRSNVSSNPIKNFNDVTVFHLIYNDYKLQVGFLQPWENKNNCTSKQPRKKWVH